MSNAVREKGNSLKQNVSIKSSIATDVKAVNAWLCLKCSCLFCSSLYKGILKHIILRVQQHTELNPA